MAEGFLRLARASGRDGRGVTVLLDDLHWADAETLAVVEYLADNIAEEPVLVVVTSRPDGPDVLRALIDRRAVTELRLGRLDDDDVVALTRACLGDASVPAPVLDLVLDRADGIPFFVEELLVGLESDGPRRAARGAPRDRTRVALPGHVAGVARRAPGAAGRPRRRGSGPRRGRATYALRREGNTKSGAVVSPIRRNGPPPMLVGVTVRARRTR